MSIISQPANEAYLSNYDRVFGRRREPKYWETCGRCGEDRKAYESPVVHLCEACYQEYEDACAKDD